MFFGEKGRQDLNLANVTNIKSYTPTGVNGSPHKKIIR